MVYKLTAWLHKKGTESKSSWQRADIWSGREWMLHNTINIVLVAFLFNSFLTLVLASNLTTFSIVSV